MSDTEAQRTASDADTAVDPGREHTAYNLNQEEKKEQDNHTALDSTANSSKPSSTAGNDEEKQKPVAPGPGDFPDGGLKAWSVVACGWCCMYTSLGWINSIGTFQTIYEQDQLRDYSPSTIAWILSLLSFVMFGGAPIFGKIFDSYGPKYLLMFGTFFHVFGLMMTSLCTEYYQFILAQSLCSGIGASAIFYSSTNSIATWFKKRRALALGLASSGSATGGVISPIMIHRIYADADFGWAVRAVAFVFLFLLIIANFGLESRLNHTPKRYRLSDFFEPLKEARFTLVSSANFMFFLAVFVPNNFIILSAIREGTSYYLAGYLLAILNGASAIGRIAIGQLGDAYGRFNCMIVTTGLSMIFVLAIWIPSQSTAPIVVFAVFIGLTTGAFVAMVAAVIGQISEISKIGTRNGTNFFVISIAALVGNPIAGALVTRNDGGYLYLQIFAGVAMAASMVLFIAARTVQVGWQWKKI